MRANTPFGSVPAKGTPTPDNGVRMSDKEHLHELVNRLPSSEAAAARRYLEFLISLQEAPVDPKMLARIDAARAKRSTGDPHEEILKEFGG